MSPGSLAQQVVGSKRGAIVMEGRLIVQDSVQRLLVTVQLKGGLLAHFVERGPEEDVFGVVWVLSRDSRLLCLIFDLDRPSAPEVTDGPVFVDVRGLSRIGAAALTHGLQYVLVDEGPLDVLGVDPYHALDLVRVLGGLLGLEVVPSSLVYLVGDGVAQLGHHLHDLGLPHAHVEGERARLADVSAEAPVDADALRAQRDAQVDGGPAGVGRVAVAADLVPRDEEDLEFVVDSMSF